MKNVLPKNPIRQHLIPRCQYFFVSFSVKVTVPLMSSFLLQMGSLTLSLPFRILWYFWLSFSSNLISIQTPPVRPPKKELSLSCMKSLVPFNVINNINITKHFYKFININQATSPIMFAIQNFNFDADRNKDKKTGEEVYFEGSKKNQLNDIKNYLKTIVSDPEKEYYRKELVKKIISYTTAGIDTSRLYPEMVLASATKDLVQKKLIYLYLSIYSSANENFARMAINTFTKDCSSLNPNIRAFAVRNIANLRFKGREQYVYPILLQGLNDFSPLVKKSCIMGLTKLIVEKNRTLETPFRDQNILNKFYQMIRQSDSSLVCTAIEAINEIEQEGIAMSKKLANYLLQNLSKFYDLQLPTILAYLQAYDPKSDEEVIKILTSLEPKLKSSSPAVALAISKIYIKIAKIKPSLLKQILRTIRQSLMAYINNDSPQLEYVVLKHIQYLIATFGTDNFTLIFKRFLIGADQPSYLKIVKVQILEKLINKQNQSDIINEFAQYLSDQSISAETVRALARVLLTAEEGEAKFIVKTIIRVIEECPMVFLCNNTLPLIRNYLRLYPQDFPMFAGVFYNLVQSAIQQQARCSAVEIIGDYGDQIQNAVELLAWNQTEISDRLKVSLLRANVKLFLKRPDEMYNVICNMFKNILTDDETHLHVKDYAAYLYRGLASGVDEFKTTFLECRAVIKHCEKEQEQLEFNSLQIVYGSRTDIWILDKLKFIQIQQELHLQPNLQQDEQIQKPKQLEINVDSRFKQLQAENFDVTFSLTSQSFEKCWQDYDIGSSITRILNNIDQLTQENLEELFKIWNISVMASADSEEEIKIYSYCRVQQSQGDLGIACMQFCIHKLPETMTLMIKCQDQQLAGFVSRYVEGFLRVNQII